MSRETMKPWNWRKPLVLCGLILMWFVIGSMVHHEWAEYVAGSAIVFVLMLRTTHPAADTSARVRDEDEFS